MAEKATKCKPNRQCPPGHSRRPGSSMFTNSSEFQKFLADQSARREEDIKRRITSAHMKDILEHQIAMLRLTRQMNQLFADIGGTRRAAKVPTYKVEAGRKSRNQSKTEYIIFSGGPRGLKYSSLKKTKKGTFRLEIDVADYNPEQLRINTENNQTMHVKAFSDGSRKTLKIISPKGVDIDDVKIHYPEKGILLLEAP